MKGHGTKIIIYNLWEDDEGMLELDFDTDPYVCVFITVLYKLCSAIMQRLLYPYNLTYGLLQDIQLRGVNRDEKNIDMASQYPNSRHFLTYKHSLRVYMFFQSFLNCCYFLS